MDSQEETKSLLKEIRDIQQEHLQVYKAIVEKSIKAQEESVSIHAPA